jgi:two-component system, cell cycle response regulator DivK
MRILLAEDNPDNREMLIRRLVKRGYEVLIACDGIEAVDRAVADQPHLILMDISMPGMSGIEATRVIRAHPDIGVSQVPIIALTAHAMASDRQLCLEAGCNGFATKPVDFPSLMAQVAQALGEEIHAPTAATAA